ncbi:MAG: hypothetical protein IMZ71_01545 [Chloroflexi bacterium]|nr:hypothetical protein [Chloroflexota bacterium]
MKRWLTFERTSQPSAARTVVVRVLSTSQYARDSGEGWLGTIEWYGAWHQYVFCPSPQTLLSAGCLAEIEAQLRELMTEWRRSADKSRTAKEKSR